jgi:hypothetical protein
MLYNDHNRWSEEERVGYAVNCVDNFEWHAKFRIDQGSTILLELDPPATGNVAWNKIVVVVEMTELALTNNRRNPL